MNASEFIRRLQYPTCTFCSDDKCDLSVAASDRCLGHSIGLGVHIMQASFARCEVIAQELSRMPYRAAPRHALKESTSRAQSAQNRKLFSSFFREAELTLGAVGDLPYCNFGQSFNTDFAAFYEWAAREPRVPHETALMIEAHFPFIDMVLNIASAETHTLSATSPVNCHTLAIEEMFESEDGWDEPVCIEKMTQMVTLVVEQLRALTRHDGLDCFKLS